jgi:hypothetical protein
VSLCVFRAPLHQGCLEEGFGGSLSILGYTDLAVVSRTLLFRDPRSGIVDGALAALPSTTISTRSRGSTYRSLLLCLRCFSDLFVIVLVHCSWSVTFRRGIFYFSTTAHTSL